MAATAAGRHSSVFDRISRPTTRSAGRHSSVFDRILRATTTSPGGFGGASPSTSIPTCKFWRVGRCNRFPCPFFHGEQPRAPRESTADADHGAAAPGPSNMGKRKVAVQRQHKQEFNNASAPKPSQVAAPPRILTKKHPSDSDGDRAAATDLPFSAPAKKRKASKVTDDMPQPHQEPAAKAPLSAEPSSASTASASSSTSSSSSASTASASTSSSSASTASASTASASTASASSASASASASTSFTSSCEVTDGGLVKEEVQTHDKEAPVLCGSFLAVASSLGENCSGLHQWFTGNGFYHQANLEAHEKDIVGITLPSECNKLLTASSDGTVALWDCATSQNIQILKACCEINCLFSDGPWIFLACQDAIQACNTDTWTSDIETLEIVTLPVPSGPVHAMAVGDDILFAGTEDGSVLSWKINTEDKSFEPAAVLNGHHGAVVSLIVGAKKLYSGSRDNTIRVWDILTLEYIDTLTGHSSVVTSLLCWDAYLLSCSLDRTIKVWGMNENNVIEVKHTHNEKHAALALKGMHDDHQGQAVLMCSYDDKTVRLYDLPTFNERGKIFSIKEVKVMQTGPCELFFTGDGAGKVNVWRWSTIEEPSP